MRDRTATASLLERGRWQAFTPQVRESVLSILLSDESQTTILLDAIERGSIDGAALGPSRRSRLMTHRDAVIQKRARALLAGLESGDRMQVYDRLRGAVLERTAERGERQKGVCRSLCDAATRSTEPADSVGPDLSGIRNQPADAILLHVIVPDYEIAAGYQSYVVETRDGRTLVGRLESEAPNSLTLRDGARAGARDPAQRRDLDVGVGPFVDARRARTRDVGAGSRRSHRRTSKPIRGRANPDPGPRYADRLALEAGPRTTVPPDSFSS